MVDRTKAGITKRQEHFAELVASGINPHKAYQLAGFSIKGAKSNAYQLMRKPEIKAIIDQTHDDRKLYLDNLTKEWIIEQLKVIADKDTGDAIKVKCLVELAKLLGYTENTLNIKAENGPLFIVQNVDKE